MAAPSNTSWGNVDGNNKGRLGIYTSVSQNDTQVTVSVEVWFWSKWSVNDSSNVFTYNGANQGSVSINHTVASGGGWSENNQTRLLTTSHTYNRGTSTTSASISTSLANIATLSGTISHSVNVNIPALPTYTVTFVDSLDGQVKKVEYVIYGGNATPPEYSKEGYAFAGWSGDYTNVTSDRTIIATWNTSKIWNNINVLSPSNVEDMLSAYFDLAYSTGYSITNILNEPTDGNAYQPVGTVMTISNIKPYYDYYELDRVDGATHIGNGSYQHTMTDSSQVVSIYMKYKSYTITYDANGGNNAPSSQSFVYNSVDKISSIIPEREGFVFVNWKVSNEDVYLNPDDTIPAGLYDFTLIAQWMYYVNYDSNGGLFVPSFEHCTDNMLVKLTKYRPTRSGYKFLGWSLNPNATIATYSHQGEYSFGGNTILYAVWEKTNQDIYMYNDGRCYVGEFIEDYTNGFGSGGRIYSIEFNESESENGTFEIGDLFIGASFIEGLPT